MTTVFMVFGGVGAGKTTYARRLEQSGAVRLSLDEWTLAATGDPVHLDRDVKDRIMDQLLRFWPGLAIQGLDVVLDFGFWDRRHRDEVRRTAAAIGAGVELIWVVCDEDEARRRSASRSPQDRDAYVIDDAGFDWILNHRHLDPIAADEPHTVIDTTNRNRPT